MEETLQSFKKLLEIMEELRAKCPWDKEQTFDSLRNLTIEETYELADAILEKDMDGIKKELGDVLLHIVFYSKMGSEQKSFDMKAVIDSLCEKLIFRHPHIFGEEKVETQKEVLGRWEELKKKEKDHKGTLAGVPKSLPAIIKAGRMQSKARAVGFDWEEKSDVWLKVQEELDELKYEIEKKDNADKIENEFGDFLFSLVNVARLYDIEPETALERTNAKFKRRFEYIEAKAKELGKNLKDMNLAEMDIFWNEAKQIEGKQD